MTPAAFPLHLGVVQVIAIEGLPLDRQSGDVLVVFEDEGLQQYRHPMHRDDIPNIGDRFVFSVSPDNRPDLRVA